MFSLNWKIFFSVKITKRLGIFNLLRHGSTDLVISMI